jgi:hypothetical protein
VTRLYALDRFPIYFFTDEAIHPVLASELLRDGLRDSQGNLFPTYFQNGSYWNLSLSVYVHLVTVALFGKSIWVTRATSAVISVFGAAAIGLILKLIFRIKSWWLVVLFLAVTPAWFLHSRTAFETTLMVSFYSWFLLFYLLYRYRSPNFLYPALIFGAATFYSYSNGQAVMLASGVLFLLADWRHHIRQWRTGLWGLGLLMLLIVPYARFRLEQPEALTSQLRILDSYWLKPISLEDKIGRLLSAEAYGLSPQYWFLPNTQDLVRHRMRDYGNLSPWLLPLFLVGALICLRQIRSAAHRALLIAALAAPFGSALAEIAVTRALLFIVPANMMAALGLDAIVSRFRSRRVQWSTTAAATILFALASFAMLRDALENGPTWYTNYGLFGMQWGARELFTQAIPAYLERNPTANIFLTPTWANGTDMFMRFFPVDTNRVHLQNIDYFTTLKRDLDSRSVLVMAPEELERARASDKFKGIDVEGTIPYPDSSDGFYFVRLAYVDNIDAVFAAEREARRKLVAETAVIDGETVQVAHSIFDGGRAQDVFDGNPFTLARGLEANPLIVELTFPAARPIQGMAGTFAKMNFRWTLFLYSGESEAPTEYTEEYIDLPAEPHAEIEFDHGPAMVSKIRMEITDLAPSEPTHIHIRDLVLK